MVVSMGANLALGAAGACVLAVGLLGINEVQQFNRWTIPGQTPVCEYSQLHLAQNIVLIALGGLLLGHEILAAVVGRK